MAYVVARPKGRFEIRESVHTPKGPRARSLANFAEFTDEVLDRARRRASRPFDAEAVREAAQRAAAPVAAPTMQAASGATSTVPRHEQPDRRHFVEAARRMATSLERLPDNGDRRDPGEALVSLFDLVAHASDPRPPRPSEPLGFPPLARLRAARGTRSDGEAVRQR